jgi:hypothetical protein
MRITSAGNVGIGTAAPAVALDIAGNNAGMRLSGTGTHQVTVTSTTNGVSGRLGQDANGFFFASDTNGKSVRFLTNNGTLNERMRITSAGNVGIGTITPSQLLSFGGQSSASVGMDPNPTAGAAGNDLTMTAGSAATGATDQPGGDLILAAGNGTGNGASGNARIQTAGASGTSGTTADTLSDRVIVVGKAKALTLTAPGFTALFSINLVGTQTAGGRVRYMVRATDGGSQVATEEGVMQYLATPNSITCTVQPTDKLHLGTVQSGCTPGFFNPGSQPGISIFDNVVFSTPAPIVVHEV